MSGKKAYPLRINTDVLAAMQRWSDDELRSVNAQIEYVLRDALREAGRLRGGGGATEADDPHEGHGVGHGDDAGTSDGQHEPPATTATSRPNREEKT